VGLFRHWRTVREVIREAPAAVEQAREVQRAYRDGGPGHPAEAAAAAAMPPSRPLEPGELEPIAGVSLETYARIVKTSADRGGGRDGLLAVARDHGVDAASWDAATAGWTARFQANLTLASRYGAIYQAV
jgi:hypothetical protein